MEGTDSWQAHEHGETSTAWCWIKEFKHGWFENLRSTPGKFWNQTLYKEDRERSKKKADHSITVGGRFNKQWNLRDLCGKTRSLHLPTAVSKVYMKALTGFSHEHRQVTSTTHEHITISKLCPWGSFWWEGKWNIHSKDRTGVWSLRFPGSSSQVNWRSLPLDYLLQRTQRLPTVWFNLNEILENSKLY